MIIKLTYTDELWEGVSETTSIEIIDRKGYIRFYEEETDRENIDHVLRYIDVIGYRFEFMKNDSILFVNTDIFDMESIMELNSDLIGKFIEVEDFYKSYNREQHLKQL